VNSAVYEGSVMHGRRAPVEHGFRYRVALPLLDLAELETVCALHPLWSARRPNAMWFRRDDFLGDASIPLDVAVRDLVEDRLGHRPTGSVRLLANLRAWGWHCNPISLYYCFDSSDTGVEALVAEVTNTPWHERHAYVIGGGPGEHWFAKELHVSPFHGMDHDYRLDFTDPGDHLSVRISNHHEGQRVFDAALDLRRRPLSRQALSRVLWRSPLLPQRTSAAIYRQALTLRRKGAPVHSHPTSRTATTKLEVHHG